jgi:hypothetical protein
MLHGGSSEITRYDGQPTVPDVFLEDIVCNFVEMLR